MIPEESPVLSSQQEQSSPDDKLITILCQAAKATYNSARDQCHVQLIPIQEMQAVAIKEITIQSELRARRAEACVGWEWGRR